MSNSLDIFVFTELEERGGGSQLIFAECFPQRDYWKTIIKESLQEDDIG